MGAKKGEITASGKVQKREKLIRQRTDGRGEGMGSAMGLEGAAFTVQLQQQE